MAEQRRSTSFSSKQFKTLMVGGFAAISSVIAVVFGQPHQASASIKMASCDVSALHQVAVNDAEFSAVGYASANAQSSDNELFWNSLTKEWLSPEQYKLLELAHEVGLEDGDEQFAETLQAVLLQETIAGQLGRIGHMTAPVGKRSYGVMQVKVSAARDVLRKHTEMGRFHSDEELIVALMTDDEFNIRVASKFLKHLQENTKSVAASLVAYNIGLRASRKIVKPNQFKYVVRTQRNLDEVVKRFNERFMADEIKVAMR